MARLTSSSWHQAAGMLPALVWSECKLALDFKAKRHRKSLLVCSFTLLVGWLSATPCQSYIVVVICGSTRASGSFFLEKNPSKNDPDLLPTQLYTTNTIPSRRLDFQCNPICSAIPIEVFHHVCADIWRPLRDDPWTCITGCIEPTGQVKGWIFNILQCGDECDFSHCDLKQLLPEPPGLRWPNYRRSTQNVFVKSCNYWWKSGLESFDQFRSQP